MIQKTWGTFAALAVAAFVLLPGAPLADPTEEQAADSRVDPDYAAGKRAIEAKDWDAAIKRLPRRRCAMRVTPTFKVISATHIATPASSISPSNTMPARWN